MRRRDYYFSAEALAGITGGLLLYITERKTAAVIEDRPLPQPSTPTATSNLQEEEEGQHMSDVMTYLSWCAIGLFIVMVCVNYYLGQIWWLEYLSCFLPVSIITFLFVCGVACQLSFLIGKRVEGLMCCSSIYLFEEPLHVVIVDDEGLFYLVLVCCLDRKSVV